MPAAPAASRTPAIAPNAGSAAGASGDRANFATNLPSQFFLFWQAYQPSQQWAVY
jgi:hypothetical protein